jgi:hypothetical protein
MVKRFYFIKGGYYPTFANLSFLYRWLTKVFDNTQRDPRKQEILVNSLNLHIKIIFISKAHKLPTSL